jgi:dienelactone hydrolase
VLKKACVSAEFRAFAANASSPVTQWLRGLARVAHGERGGPGVGAIGMCFTGNFALSMMLEPFGARAGAVPTVAAFQPTQRAADFTRRARHREAAPRA